MKFKQLVTPLLSIGLLFTSVANAGLITTTFNSNNSNEGAMFNINILDNNLTFTSAELNMADIGSTTIEIYTRVGGYLGYESSPADWLLTSSVDIQLTEARGIPTLADFSDFTLLANTTYGIYFHSTDFEVDVAYTDGSNSYVNDDLSLDLGVGINGYFNGTFSDRTWNGTLYYDIANAGNADVPAPSALALLLLACAGMSISYKRRK